MSFKAAVETSQAPINQAYEPGKQALKGTHRAKVECAAPERLTGSIDLDGCLESVPAHSKANRWDYGIGFKSKTNGAEHAVWVEVHPASTGEVADVIRKLAWLRQLLKESAPELDAITRRGHDSVAAYHWLATDAGVHITPNSPQARRLRLAGLGMPRRSLKLP